MKSLESFFEQIQKQKKMKLRTKGFVGWDVLLHSALSQLLILRKQTQGEQQKKQAYESLKAEFTAQIQQVAQQQMGAMADKMNIDVERQPQFQEEWHKMRTQMDLQYIQLLGEYKQELLTIA